jgi:hypothetical protein
MKDWKAIARSAAVDIPEADVHRIVAPLDALEAVFRPLVKDLPPDVEPEFGLGVEEEGE